MEGVIKFDLDWTSKDLVSEKQFAWINPWRRKCYERGYVGEGKDGIGYGNISFRTERNSNEFVISASGTGRKEDLEQGDYALVTHYDLATNSLSCKGGGKASSESMTHAAIYSANHKVQVVIHIHQAELWAKHLHILLTTDSEIEYGTVEMAYEVAKKVGKVKTNNGTLILGGHQDGIIVYAESFDICLELLERL